MRFQDIRSFVGRHKRSVIILSSSAIFILLVGGYALWSIHAWSGYKTTHETWHNTIKKDIHNALALSATNYDERSRKMSRLQHISTNITSAKSSLCDVSGLFSWQRIISSIKTEREACDRNVTTADMFNIKMRQTISYLESEQSLGKIIAPLMVQDKITEASWDSQPASWQAAADTIKKMSVNTTFAPVKTNAVDVTRSIQSAWQMLISAHKAKDKAKYLDAQSKLTQAYSGLPLLATKSTEHFNTIVKPLQDAYQRAFIATVS